MKNIEVVGGIVVGAFIGTALGLLYAPDEGYETRKKIVSEADRRAEKIIEENTGKNGK